MAKALERIEQGEIPVDFNWNKDFHLKVPLPKSISIEPSVDQVKKTVLLSECLRDGLHGVQKYPSVEDMLEYIGLLHSLGIDQMTVGIFTGTKDRIGEDTKKLLSEMDKNYPQVTPIVLTLATEESLFWTFECKQLNPRLNSIVFMGTGPFRMVAQNWERDFVLSKLEWAVRKVVGQGIDVIGATENTTQTPPDFLEEIIKVQVGNGAKYFCIADTVGAARPIGVFRIVNFVKNVLNKMGSSDVLIDWHGHRDQANDLANAMVAIATGANRVHTVARGRGERAGNAQLEAVLLNLNQILKEDGSEPKWNNKVLSRVLAKYDEITGEPMPTHGPLGSRAFKTSLGIHSDAMVKTLLLALEAEAIGNKTLSETLHEMHRTIYTAVDPNKYGLSHEVVLGHFSGESTLEYICHQENIDPNSIDPDFKKFLMSLPKMLGRELTTQETREILNNINYVEWFMNNFPVK